MPALLTDGYACPTLKKFISRPADVEKARVNLNGKVHRVTLVSLEFYFFWDNLSVTALLLIICNVLIASMF